MSDHTRINAEESVPSTSAAATDEPTSATDINKEDSGASTDPQIKSGKREPKSLVSEDEKRICWICLSSDEDNRLAAWVQPCKCRGTTKWVHQSCLYRWVYERQMGNALRAVVCQQCQTEYVIVFPEMGKLANVLEAFDNAVKRVCPHLAGGLFVGSIYWTAVTYGAVTFLQVVGYKNGLALMQNVDPLILWIGLPAIPVGLVLGRMIRWDDAVIRLIRNHRSVARKLPLMNLIFPYPEEEEVLAAQIPANPTLSDQVSPTHIFCGALLLPTFSTIVGSLLFEAVENTWHRTLLGGLLFIGAKGALKIYLKIQQYHRNQERRIVDYTEENLRLYASRHSNRQDQQQQHRPPHQLRPQPAHNQRDNIV